jgi:branched-chain amino acid transport system permease protein
MATRTASRLTPLTVFIWAMRLSAVILIVWGATASLASGRLGGAQWRDLVTFGISQGSLYALVALGYTMVYGVLGFINFAHGEVFMVGGMAGWASFAPLVASGLWFTNRLLSLVIAFVVCVVASATTAVALERLVYRPLRGAPRLTLMVSSIGASLFIQYAVLHLLSPLTKAWPPVPELFGWWTVLGFRVFRTQLLVMVGATAALAALWFLLERTRTGRAMRATGEDIQAAALMGVNVDRAISQTFAVGGALAGAAVFLFALLFPRLYYLTGLRVGLKAFTAAVLGGIGNLPGAVLGGYTLGLLEALGPSLVLAGLGIPAAWQIKDVLAFLVLILILIFRPSGLLGERLPQDAR